MKPVNVDGKLMALMEMGEFCALVSPDVAAQCLSEGVADLIDKRMAAEEVASKILAGGKPTCNWGELVFAPSKVCRRCRGAKPCKKGQRYCESCSRISRVESMSAFYQKRRKVKQSVAPQASESVAPNDCH